MTNFAPLKNYLKIQTMKEEQKKRNPYADMGLMVAITMIIVTILKCLLFDITWESIFWIILATAYCIISYILDSESSKIKHCTTAFLITSVIAFVGIIFMDRKPQPKMHAFEGAKKDTVSEEVFIMKEEPEIKEQEDKAIAITDTITATEEENTMQEETASEEEPVTEVETETNAEE